jgi:hypothetical protein
MYSTGEKGKGERGSKIKNGTGECPVPLLLMGNEKGCYLPLN